MDKKGLARSRLKAGLNVTTCRGEGSLLSVPPCVCLSPCPSLFCTQDASPWEAPNLFFCTKGPVYWLSFSFSLFKVEVGISFQTRRWGRRKWQGASSHSAKEILAEGKVTGGFRWAGDTGDIGSLGWSESLLAKY